MASRISMARAEIEHPAPTGASLALCGAAPASPSAPDSAAALVESAADELQSAWETNPRCLECGQLIASVGQAALLVGAMRVTHRHGCFIPALLRAHPQLRLLSPACEASAHRGVQVIPRHDVRDLPPTSLSRGHEGREPHRG